MKKDSPAIVDGTSCKQAIVTLGKVPGHSGNLPETYLYKERTRKSPVLLNTTYLLDHTFVSMSNESGEGQSIPNLLGNADEH